METKAHHALVGFFVVFLTAAGAFFALWLGQISLDKEYREYDIVFTGTVTGLRQAADVRFNGIQVGEVIDLGLNPEDPNQVIARIRVDAETPVKTDSTAQLDFQGLTGLSYILLSGGSNGAGLLHEQSGSRVPRIYARQSDLEELFAGGETTLEAAQQALARISTLLSDENIESASAMLNNLEELSDQLSDNGALMRELRDALVVIEDAGQNLSAAGASLTQTSQSVNTYVVNDLTPATQNTNLAAQSIDHTAKLTAQTLEDLRPGLEDFAQTGLPELTLAIEDLRRLLGNVERISVELEDNPTGFIAGTNGEEVELPQ
ncbi:MlaD family protein [Woodsholea maritima]|uniref:MlaD family protein n=1 Tax=Woodsholea maritima TaxID=240237 RepID=UPI000377390E|nr:MlaD family protein [Woodsholea maritima]